jgi:transposase
VAERLGVSYKSMHDWIVRYSKPEANRKTENSALSEIQRLKAELKRVTEERDILKEAACTLPGSQRKVHVHKITAPRLFYCCLVSNTASP